MDVNYVVYLSHLFVNILDKLIKEILETIYCIFIIHKV